MACQESELHLRAASPIQNLNIYSIEYLLILISTRSSNLRTIRARREAITFERKRKRAREEKRSILYTFIIQSYE